jgi:CRISPR-associated protein Cmr1
MEQLEAKFQIVTPMFLGGANQDTSDGIRPPSIKGALRFWWRALNWGVFRSKEPEKSSDGDANALRNLHKKESQLFGSTANEQCGGQGSFLLTVKQKHGTLSETEGKSVHPQFSRELKDAPARYLGYGLMEAFSSPKNNKEAGNLFRGCINENQHFTVRLISRGEIDPTIQNALIVMGLLGGLGSRSRHGMGSIALLTLHRNNKEIWTAPQTQDEYEAELQRLMKTCHLISGEPPFSAFSKQSRVDFALAANTPYDVLNLFGKAMLMYRSWGKNGKVLGSEHEKRFQDDHDWFKEEKTFRKNNPDFHPKRVVFGLPHNYHKHPKHHVSPEKQERRSSPLLFHVHPVGEQYIGTCVFLKSQFLPDKEKIKAGDKVVPAKIDWKIITDFLDGVAGKASSTGGIRRFPSLKKVIL